jgi:transcriptional regulator with XRE-family HTH domain
VSSSLSDTVYGITTPAQLVKELRTRHGLSQRELAYRAGTSQSAIARIEGGDEDITWKRLTAILAAMGERPQLASTRLPHRYDPDLLMRDRATSPTARLANGISFNRFGSKLAIAGAEARAKNARSA